MRTEVRSDQLQDALMDGDFRTWQCENCGFIYSEQDGLPEEGIAPGTRWEQIPDDFVCPTCGFGKAQFSMIEI